MFQNKSDFGFTMTEIIVVTFIIVLLSVFLFPIHQTSREQLILQRSASKLAQDIRRAQEMAMSAKDFGQPGDQKTISKGGYGIYFTTATPEDRKKYILFADCNENQKYDQSGIAQSCLAAEGVNTYPENFETIEFEKGVEISSLSPAPFARLDITFTPPEPTTRVNGDPSAPATIILQIDNAIARVKVLPTGLIFVE